MYVKREEYNPKEKKIFAKFMMRFVDVFLVRNDVPPFCLAAGNPAVVKKQYIISEGYYE